MHRADFLRAAGLFFLVFVFGFSPVSSRDRSSVKTPSPSPVGTELTDTCLITSTDKTGDISLLTDSDPSTAWQSESGSLVISSQTPVCYLYLEYFSVPDRTYEISGGLTGGDTPFLSEVVTLPSPQKTVTLSAAGVGGGVTVLRVFGEGDLPADVPVWEKTPDKAALMLLAAHPDDDLLWFGGTLPYYSGVQKLNTAVVYLTSPSRRRMSEALYGLWTAGVKQYPVFGNFPDKFRRRKQSELNIWGESDVNAFLTEQLRRYKPDVVLTHSPDGEYGHAAHKVAAASLMTCLHSAEDASFFPASADAYGLWTPKKVYLHAYGENPVKMNWDIPLASFGGKTGFEMANEAFACHVTQQTGRHLLRHDGKTGCTEFGLYLTKVGKDVYGNDFFENIPITPDMRREVLTEAVPSVPFGVEGSPVVLVVPQDEPLPAGWDGETMIFDRDDPFPFYIPFLLLLASAPFGWALLFVRKRRKNGNS